MNADNELSHVTIHRDFWINPLNGDPALVHPVTHRGRRIFPLNFTCPEDGEMRIFVRPIRQGISTTTRYFYATMKLDYEIKG